MGRKSTAEVEARRLDVYEMMMQGKNINFITSYCATNWNVKRSAVEKDMIAVRQDLLKEFQQQKEEIIATHVARYEKLYEFYMDKGSEEEGWNTHFNPEIASKMMEKKEKLLRLHNPEVVINNNTQNNSLNLKDIEFNDLLRILQETNSNRD